MVDIATQLEALAPRRKGLVIDLLKTANIDVSGWFVNADGSQAKSPATNPHYCYEWAFGAEDESSVLCVWHRSLKAKNDKIVYEDNIRSYALNLDLIAIDRASPSGVRLRARDQAKRARRFDQRLQWAFRRNRPIRVMLLEGRHHDETALGWGSSKVDLRELDEDEWFIHDYSDDDGSFCLVRGVPKLQLSKAQNNEIESRFVDQFSIPRLPDRVAVNGSAIPRSSQERAKALQRAQGNCEFCRKPGFVTHGGGIYLETHHVISLSENGPDIEWNIVAICADDHRRAHYGDARIQIRRQFVELLINKYPAAKSALMELARND